MIYLVSYDLNKPKQDYRSLIDAIESYADACHVLKSQWLICSAEKATEIYIKLRKYIDDDDWLLICEFTKNQCGWVSGKAADWIKRHL